MNNLMIYSNMEKYNTKEVNSLLSTVETNTLWKRVRNIIEESNVIEDEYNFNIGNDYIITVGKAKGHMIMFIKK